MIFKLIRIFLHTSKINVVQTSNIDMEAYHWIYFLYSSHLWFGSNVWGRYSIIKLAIILISSLSSIKVTVYFFFAPNSVMRRMHLSKPILGSMIIFKPYMFWILCLKEVTCNIQANYHLDFILELYSVGFVSCFCTKRMHHCRPILRSIIIFKWFMFRISFLGDEVNILVNCHWDFILELYNDSFLFQFFLPNIVMENVAPHQIV